MEENSTKKVYVSVELNKLGSLYAMTESMATGMYVDIMGRLRNRNI